MSTLTIERRFSVAPARVFAFVTQTEHLMQWWGPQGMTIQEHNLDLSRRGAWSSTLVSPQGGRHKMSGEVLAVDPPSSVEFTWGWHDENDLRGHQSHVRFEIKASEGGGSEFKLVHMGLVDDESAQNHTKGWTSSLRKLEQFISAAQ